MSFIEDQPASSSSALSGYAVLVTRPREQAGHLCQLIEAAGGKAIRFPVIEILPTSDQQRIEQIVSQLDDFDIAIFISANAVSFAMDRMAKYGGLPETLLVAAIGKATANALEQSGVSVDIFPDKKFNSESLLSMPQMQQVDGKKIVIFKGEGGRELLADTLSNRGAQVVYADVYRRALPEVDSDNILQRWTQDDINVVTVTSQEGLDNLSRMLGKKGLQLLQQTPMVTISQRVLEITRKLDIQAPVMIAKEASDEAILAALIELASKQDFRGTQ